MFKIDAVPDKMKKIITTKDADVDMLKNINQIHKCCKSNKNFVILPKKIFL